MGIFSKTFWCDHVYKEEKEEFLRKQRDDDSPVFSTNFNNYNYYAIYQKCIKCGKTRVFEKRKLIL